VQKTQYYPSGTPFAESFGAGEQAYKFTGKEMITMHGLNWQDFGARWLDNARLQFTSVDPLAEKYYSISPYAYCGGNPVNMIDPTGMLGEAWTSTHTDENGKVIAVFDDGDLGVYKHKGVGAAAKTDVDENYSSTNTSAGGEYMGRTLFWDSFTDYDTQKPTGKIDFNSCEAYDWLEWFNATMDMYIMNSGDFAILRYAYNAGNEDIFDFKTKGNGDIYRGSKINGFGTPIYESARNIGNIVAGYAASKTGMKKLDFFLTAGAFNMHRNNKLQLIINLNKYKQEALKAGISYGEDYRSHRAQKFGYEHFRIR